MNRARQQAAWGLIVLGLAGLAPAAEPNWSDAQRQHWSFRPVRRAEPPAVRRADWVRNPIDGFILASLEKFGLPPAAEADRATLIRRLSFDLTGLPPAPEEVDAFLADD